MSKVPHLIGVSAPIQIEKGRSGQQSQDGDCRENTEEDSETQLVDC